MSNQKFRNEILSFQALSKNTKSCLVFRTSCRGHESAWLLLASEASLSTSMLS